MLESIDDSYSSNILYYYTLLELITYRCATMTKLYLQAIDWLCSRGYTELQATRNNVYERSPLRSQNIY